MEGKNVEILQDAQTKVYSLDPSVKRGFLHEPFGPKGITKKPRRTQRVRLRFFVTFCLQSIRTEIPRLTDGSRYSSIDRDFSKSRKSTLNEQKARRMISEFSRVWKRVQQTRVNMDHQRLRISHVGGTDSSEAFMRSDVLSEDEVERLEEKLVQRSEKVKDMNTFVKHVRGGMEQ